MRLFDMPASESLELKVLDLLVATSQHSALIKCYLAAGAISAVPSNMIEASLLALKSLGNELTTSSHAVALERLAQNSQHELKFASQPDPADFCQVCTGDELRWEYIGVILTLSGISALLFPSQAALLISAREHAAQMLWASNWCLDTITREGSENILTGWLLCENLNLLTMQYGEASGYLLGPSSTQ